MKKMGKGVSFIGIIILLSGNLYGQTVSHSEALTRLQEGNRRFSTSARNNQGISKDNIAENALQKKPPFAVILGSSEAALSIENIFDTGASELYTIRNAGNIVDNAAAASIEFAVVEYGVGLVVVLGYDKCDTIAAMLANDTTMANYQTLSEEIGPAIQMAKMAVVESEWMITSVRINVWNSIEKLIKNSPALTEKIRVGQVKVIGAVFHSRTGEVEWMGEHPKQKLMLYSIPMKATIDIAKINPNVNLVSTNVIQDNAIIKEKIDLQTNVVKTNVQVVQNKVAAKQALSIQYFLMNALYVSVRNPVYITLISQTPLQARYASVKVYVRKLDKNNKFITKDLIFSLNSINVFGGKFQTQFYWKGRNINGTLLPVGKYVLYGEVTVWDKSWKKLGTTARTPLPMLRYALTLD